MLDDATKANTALEAQQARLTEETRDKDVIIRHLESLARSRQDTPVVKNRSSMKSTKLPDPAIFEGPPQDVNN